MSGYFIAGTDTGIGKTLVAVNLIRTLARQQKRVVGMKPIAAGADPTPDGLRNDDAVALWKAGNVNVDYAAINPYCLPAPVSPHIAAREAGVTIDIDRIVRSYAQLEAMAEVVVVEGAGGWLAPISDDYTMADVAKALRLPVVLIVGLRLGCLNHALLTAQGIAASGLELTAWIGSHVDPSFARPHENLATLTQRLRQAPAAIVPHGVANFAVSF
jgi:dethiobiotin synthetase